MGRFAKLSGLTTHALRHYDSVGLPNPAQVDPDTGYRYYAREQLVTTSWSWTCAGWTCPFRRSALSS